MSNYLVHFTKGGEMDDPLNEAYKQQLGILSGTCVKAINPFGCANKLKHIQASQKTVCLSEVPAGQWERLVKRRSCYGVGFTKAFIKQAGGGRVWYLDPNTPHTSAFKALRSAAVKRNDPDEALWKTTPFIDFVSPRFYEFDWEREWRVVGDLHFTPDDASFLFVPEHLHDAARAFLQDGNGGAGPAYTCPIVDPRWDHANVIAALEGN